MKNGKLTKLPHQEMDRSKTGQTGRGLRREANKGKTTRGGEGCEDAEEKHGGHNRILVRLSCGFERVQVVLRCHSVDFYGKP